MMKDYIVRVSMSSRVNNPAAVLDKLFSGELHQGVDDAYKYIQWEELREVDTDKLIAKRTVIDWGL